MTKARDLSKLFGTNTNGVVPNANLDVSFENIVDTGTEGTKVATGTTAQRGTTAGQLRFNSTTGLAEYYNGSNFKSIDIPPIITSVDVTNVQTELGGTETFVITGSNFSSGITIKFRDNSGTLITPDTISLDSSTQITVTKTRSSFLNANEPYDLIATNTSGLQGTLDNGINVDNTPSFNTASGTLATINDADSGNHATVSATDPDGDTISYSVSSGALPSGITINSITGVISGNPVDVASQTTYNFDVKATGSSLFSTRSFNLIVNPSPDGSSSARVASSATAIKAIDNSVTNGDKWINLDGTPTLVYCDFDGTYSQDASNSYMLYQSYGSNNPLANAIYGSQLNSYTALQNKGWSFTGSTFGQNQDPTHAGFNHHGGSSAYGEASLNSLDLKGLTGINKITIWYGGIGYTHTLYVNGTQVATAPVNNTPQQYNGSFNPTGTTPYVSMTESTGIVASNYIWIADT